MSDVKPRAEETFMEMIYKWKHFWMNQHQNSKADYENYHNRAFGVDANMIHNLAAMIAKDYEALRAQNEELVRVLESTKCVCGYELLNSEGVYHLGCWVPSSSKKLIQKCSRCEALAKYRGKNG